MKDLWFRYIILMGMSVFWIYLPWKWDILPLWARVVEAASLGAVMGISSWVFFTEVVSPERKQTQEESKEE